MTVDDIPAYCDMLIMEGLLTHEQVSKAIMNQLERGGYLIESLVEMGYMKFEDFDLVFAHQTDVAVLDLNRCAISEGTVAVLPESIAFKHRVFPIDKLGPLLTLGMAVPTDKDAIRQIESATGLRVKPVYCKPRDINAKIREHYGDASAAN